AAAHGRLDFDGLDAAGDDGAAAGAGADRRLLQRNLVGVPAVAVGDNADGAIGNGAQGVGGTPESDFARAAGGGHEHVTGPDQSARADVADFAEPDPVGVHDILRGVE